MTTFHPRALGQILLAQGVVSSELLEAALVEQRQTRERIGIVLARHGIDAESVARALATQLRLDYCEPPIRSDPAALALVESRLAERLRLVPVSADERRVRIAMADPLDVEAIDDVQFQTGRRVEPMVASIRTVELGLTAYQSGEVDAIVDRIDRKPRVGEPPESADIAALRRASEAAPIVALVDLVLKRAIRAGASDIHIEPAGDSLRVRVRTDGVLRPLMDLPSQAARAFTSRVKIMADMDISVRRRPQDGRAVVRVEDRAVGMRVSTLPSQNGEKTVLRILDSASFERGLDELGFDGRLYNRFLELLAASHGVILVTGPTGSGKTTTLYAALARLDRETRNIITLEDPIEYRLAGLTQVQVHRRAGLGFAAALRAVLRQDPDVIMVGELRDRETAETAMAAAMTGHLVLSTVHTNDAPSAATRLIDMGTQPYLIAAGLIGVLAQRLVRRLCPGCADERVAPAAELAALGLPARDRTVAAARGCHACAGTGYSGRIAILELMIVNAAVRERLARGAPAEVVREAATAGGTESLARDAWRRVRQRLTTIEEVRPLLGLLARDGANCSRCGAPLRSTFRACPSCGAILRRSCECGALIEASWKFCPECASSRSPRESVGSRQSGSGTADGIDSRSAGAVTRQADA
jgi:type IV pilus assembly protein PilB